MRKLKQAFSCIAILILTMSFLRCSTAKALQSKAPISLGDVYCQSWVAGVKGGGAGLNIFIPTTDTSVKLEQVYFRGKVASLETREGLYIGRYSSGENQLKHLALGTESKEDKVITPKDEAFPFTLKDSECVVSYKENNKTKYFKIKNVLQKEKQYNLSAPPQNQRNFNNNR